MPKSTAQKEAIFRRIIVILLYTSFVLMFLAAAFRRVAPWIKDYHVTWGPRIILVLLLLHFWSVRKLIKNAFVSKMQTPGAKFKYSIILCMLLTLIAIFITAHLRKLNIIIRDFHTIYLPVLFTILIIMHIFSVLRRKLSTGEVQMRKDYRYFPQIAAALIIIALIIAVTMIILQKLAIL